MDFIDTHLHLIYRGELGYGWTAGIPALAEGDFTLEDYAGLAQGRGIAGALFMEAGVDDGDFQAEARLIAGLVGRHGLLGQIAACRPEDDAGFDAWLDECAGLHVKGFRRILHVMPDEEKAHTDVPVTLRQGQSVITGQGGIAIDNKSQITVLLGPAAATIHRKPQ